MAEPRPRKIMSRDWDKVEAFINEQYDARKTAIFRKNHEEIWKEVDRQVSMKPPTKMSSDGKPMKTWHAALEMGELSKASEIIASDVMRIMFPQDRFWFQPHVELSGSLDEQTGRPQKIPEEKQKIADGLLRSLMAQQHKDFGFKARFRLSVKEALHHGSFVSEIRFMREIMVRDGDSVREVGAPVWVPYSMWNAYPDPSPSVIGTNLFYTGAMILVEYMPLDKLKRMAAGKGWMQDRLKKVNKDRHQNKENETADIQLIKWKGDISIERNDGDDIYLPNSEVILANGILVYYGTGEMPYPNVIFAGYERQDVRDPYYTSPIIKLSPSHKALTIVTNKFLDWVALQTEPPIEYDGNDPDYVTSGGPTIAPGAKSATKSIGNGFKQLQIGEGKTALEAISLLYQQHREGLGISSQRSGVQSSDRQTATEINAAAQGAEVRTMEFISQLEPQGLLPFLYMQHEYNRAKMTEYTFYNDEMHTPDFIRARRNDIQANAHFEIVGSRGVLGEERRANKVANVTTFFASSPLFADKLNTQDIMLEMYRDAGKKNPEEWVNNARKSPAQDPQVQAEIQKRDMALKETQDTIAALQQELAKNKSSMAIKMQELDLERQKAKADLMMRQAELSLEKAKAHSDQQLDRMALAVEIQKIQADAKAQSDKLDNDFSLQTQKIAADFTAKMKAIDDAIEKQNRELSEKTAVKEPNKRKTKVTRTASGAGGTTSYDGDSAPHRVNRYE